MARPFRFGIQCSSLPGADSSTWADLARKVEDLGYATLTVADHFDDQLASVPALMAAADATTSLRVGALVFCSDYKHPFVLAKEAATIDVLSSGRFEFGLGAGWMTTDYEQAGIVMDRPSIRIGRMEDALAVVKRQWADGHPQPVQRPGPPVLIGGGGQKMLTVAGRHADIVGLNIDLRRGVIDAQAGANGTEAATRQKIGWIRDTAGERFDQIELHVRVHLALVTDDRDGVAEAVAPAFGLSPAEALRTPHALCGTVDQIAEDLIARRERFGISYIGLGVDVLDTMAPVVARLAGA